MRTGGGEGRSVRERERKKTVKSPQRILNSSERGREGRLHPKEKESAAPGGEGEEVLPREFSSS